MKKMMLVVLAAVLSVAYFCKEAKAVDEYNYQSSVTSQFGMVYAEYEIDYGTQWKTMIVSRDHLGVEHKTFVGNFVWIRHMKTFGDGNKVFMYGYGGAPFDTVFCFDFADPENIIQITLGEGEYVHDYQLVYDGKLLLSTTSSSAGQIKRNIRYVDLNTGNSKILKIFEGNVTFVFGFEDDLSCFLVAATTSQKIVTVYKVAEEKPVLKPLKSFRLAKGFEVIGINMNLMKQLQVDTSLKRSVFYQLN